MESEKRRKENKLQGRSGAKKRSNKKIPLPVFLTKGY